MYTFEELEAQEKALEALSEDKKQEVKDRLWFLDDPRPGRPLGFSPALNKESNRGRPAHVDPTNPRHLVTLIRRAPRILAFIPALGEFVQLAKKEAAEAVKDIDDVYVDVKLEEDGTLVIG